MDTAVEDEPLTRFVSLCVCARTYGSVQWEYFLLPMLYQVHTTGGWKECWECSDMRSVLFPVGMRDIRKLCRFVAGRIASIGVGARRGGVSPYSFA